MKQTSVRGGTKLSGRNINLENIGKVLRIGASDRRRTDGRKFVVYSLMDWKPAKCVQKWGKYGQVLTTPRLPRAALIWIF